MIGSGTLGQGYGVAVSDYSTTEGEIYVPDAASGTVKVYDPAVNLTTPVEEINGRGTPQRGFHSLADSAVAIDQADGHLFVADNLEPGFETPAAVVDEFNAAGDYRGQLPHPLTDAEPSALAVDEHGRVYVTSGNGRKRRPLRLRPDRYRLDPDRGQERRRRWHGDLGTGRDYCGFACAAEYDRAKKSSSPRFPTTRFGLCRLERGRLQRDRPLSRRVPGAGAEVTASFAVAPETMALRQAPATTEPVAPVESTRWGTHRFPRRPISQPTAHSSEVEQRAGIRLSVDGKLTPHALPRHGTAPVRVAVGVKVAAVGGGPPPQLRKLAIAINRHGRFDPAALPRCPLREIQPSTNSGALKACRRSLVGEGTFSANVLLPEQSPFPSAGKVYAFNGAFHGHPAILAHVYGTQPVPTSYTIPFELTSLKGTFGTLLSAALPRSTSQWGYVTGISLDLKPSTGNGRPYLSAGCPVPEGASEAPFPFARVTISVTGKPNISTTATRSCTVRG